MTDDTVKLVKLQSCEDISQLSPDERIARCRAVGCEPREDKVYANASLIYTWTDGVKIACYLKP